MFLPPGRTNKALRCAPQTISKQFQSTLQSSFLFLLRFELNEPFFDHPSEGWFGPLPNAFPKRLLLVHKFEVDLPSFFVCSVLEIGKREQNQPKKLIEQKGEQYFD